MQSENNQIIELIQLMDIIEPERIPEIISAVIGLMMAKHFHRMFDDQFKGIMGQLNL